jgi:hypothetical protein
MVLDGHSQFSFSIVFSRMHINKLLTRQLLEY